MSPLMLVLLVMFIPPEEPICLFFILDAKSLSATAIEIWGACEDRGEERRGAGVEGRGERRTPPPGVEGAKGEIMEERTE